MNVTMSVRDLLDGLNNVTRALAVRPVKPILEGVLLDAYENHVVLTGTNGSLTIETTLTAQVKEEGSMVLPGKLFTEIIRKMPEGDVKLSSSDSFQTIISSGKIKAKLSGMNPAEFPEMSEVVGGVNIAVPQNVLRDMISRVVFAIAIDESKPVLTGCLMEISDSEIRMVALDGYRLALQKREMSFDLPDNKTFKAIVPGRVLSELSKMLLDETEPCELLFDRNRMQASFANTKLSTVLLAGEYIDYRRILPASFNTRAKTRRTAVQESIDRASLMAREGKNNLIRMSFGLDSLTINSSAEMGDIKEEMDAVLEGDPIDIAFNAKYLSEVIRNVDEDDLCLNLNSSVSPCVFTPTEGDKYLYLVLPVRVFQ